MQFLHCIVCQRVHNVWMWASVLNFVQGDEAIMKTD